MVQQIFDQFYNRADSFPQWFALVAGLSASASFLNSMIVMRLGMRRLISAALRIQIVWSLGMLLLYAQGLMAGDLGFALFIFWDFRTVFSSRNDVGQPHSFGYGATRAYRRHSRQRHQRGCDLGLYPIGLGRRAIF